MAVLCACGVIACVGTQRPGDRAASIELLEADADVWAFDAQVEGAARGASITACVVERNGHATTANIEGDRFRAALRLAPGDNLIEARCRTDEHRTLRSQRVRFRVRFEVDPLAEGSAAAQATPAPAAAAWLDRAVGYGVLPPVFGRSGLRDVTAALDELAELGVDALWLAPIFVAAEGDYGYAVVDYFQVRPDYGTAADLTELVRAAHARNMRVVLDLPANHTSIEHPYYRQSAELGARSRYYEFYDRDARGRATHYFDWKHLPNLDFDNREVARFMLAAAQHWVAEFDVDGYRVDAAWGVRQRTPEYWPVMRRALARVEPEVLLVAEASARDPYYLQNGFDVAYDWTHELGKHAWGQVFGPDAGVARRLDAAVQASSENRMRILRFLNNNDTGARFITKHGEPMTRVATAALLTLPGVPCLYSFDEVGGEFQPYEELSPVEADRPQLRAFHKRFIQLRRTRPALWSESFEVLHIGERDDAYAYLRGRAAETLLVVLNFAGQPAKLSLDLPAEKWPGVRARDVFSGEVIELSKRSLELQADGWAARAFEPL